jgi:hypothetical protein
MLSCAGSHLAGIFFVLPLFSTAAQQLHQALKAGLAASTKKHYGLNREEMQ